MFVCTKFLCFIFSVSTVVVAVFILAQTSHCRLCDSSLCSLCYALSRVQCLLFWIILPPFFFLQPISCALLGFSSSRFLPHRLIQNSEHLRYSFGFVWMSESLKNQVFEASVKHQLTIDLWCLICLLKNVFSTHKSGLNSCCVKPFLHPPFYPWF